MKGAFVVVFVAFGAASFIYPPKARWIPLIIATGGLVVAVANLFVPGKRATGSRTGPNEESYEGATTVKRELVVWSLVGLFFCLLTLCGLILGSALFLLVFLKWFWKEKWSVSILVPILTAAGIYALFHIAFQMRLYRGLF